MKASHPVSDPTEDIMLPVQRVCAFYCFVDDKLLQTSLGKMTPFLLKFVKLNHLDFFLSRQKD